MPFYYFFPAPCFSKIPPEFHIPALTFLRHTVLSTNPCCKLVDKKSPSVYMPFKKGFQLGVFQYGTH